MRILTASLVCLTLCTSIENARADLKFQSQMEAACRPAAPVTYTPLRWQGGAACSDCFTWRVSCSNGRSWELRSNLHPGTTTLQAALYEWVPWSFLLYLLPFLVLIGIATVGSQAAPLLIVSNALFLTYAIGAAWSLYASLTGNPGGSSVELQHALFLNPWAYGAIVGVFVLLNMPALLRGLEAFFYHHPAAPTVVPLHPFHAASMSAALMPQLHEFVDPGDTASHYRRQADRLRALKDRLDAQTALAKAVIRHHRARNGANDEI